MKTVVIVDDEPITRMDLSDILSDLNFQVVGEASDGFDAIELCRSKQPDVVLMDVKMPIFDGLTASETILSEQLAGCVVLLTAFSDPDIIERANRAGVTGYLVKPIDQKSLLPTIEVALAQSLRMREARKTAEDSLRQVQEERQIRKAQQYVAKVQGCSDVEAYQYMRKTAMDKRMPLAVLAEHILSQAEKNDVVGKVKGMLMRKKNFPENKAYHYIRNYAKTHGCDMEEAARQIQSYLEREL